MYDTSGSEKDSIARQMAKQNYNENQNRNRNLW